MYVVTWWATIGDEQSKASLKVCDDCLEDPSLESGHATEVRFTTAYQCDLCGITVQPEHVRQEGDLI